MSRVLPVSKAHPASKERGARLAIPELVVQAVSEDQLENWDPLVQPASVVVRDRMVNRVYRVPVDPPDPPDLLAILAPEAKEDQLGLLDQQEKEASQVIKGHLVHQDHVVHKASKVNEVNVDLRVPLAQQDPRVSLDRTEHLDCRDQVAHLVS